MHTRSLCLLVALPIAFSANGCGESSEPRPTNTQTNALAVPVGKIAFVSDKDGFPNIYAANSDGSGLTRLTNNSEGDGDIFPEGEDQYGFAWSPEGSRMVFETARDDFIRWYVMNSDGSGESILTNDLLVEPDSVPTWSPDGKRIAVMGLEKGMCLLNADGTDLRCMELRYSAGLTWSPDGQRLAFLTAGGGSAGEDSVSIMNPDGSGRTEIANNASGDSLLSWSRDGTRIAFNSYYLGANADVHVAHIDGSKATRLTDHEAIDFHPAWSPAGDRIAFSSMRDGNYEIYSMNTDGSDLFRLTDTVVHDVLPAWSPDGRQIAFVSLDQTRAEAGGEGYDADIYVVNADGSGLTLVADAIAGFAVPQWQPRD